MSRGLDSAVIDILASRAFLTVDIVEMEFDTPLYLTNSCYDMVTSTATSDGVQTYVAQGDFISMSPINEGHELRVNQVGVVVQAATTTYTDIVNNDNYLHRRFRLYRCFLSNTDLALLASPVLVYDGSFTGATIDYNETDATVRFTTANEFYDFEKVAGRKTNDGSQQKYYPGDKGMRYSTSAIGELKWGKE